MSWELNVVFSSEFDKFCQVTYEANFGEKPEGDITLIEEKNIPNHDLLLAGFPCQAFSYAGLKKGFEDTRGTQFFDIARIINHHKPKAFLLENVKGLRSHDNGRTLHTIIKTLNSMNYNLFVDVLNAKDFGLPQNRERIFIIGFKSLVNFEFPAPPKIETRLGNILHKNPSNKLTISNKIWASHKKRKKELKKKDMVLDILYLTEIQNIQARFLHDIIKMAQKFLLTRKKKSKNAISSGGSKTPRIS